MAEAALDDKDRVILLATAEHWRSLGKEAQAAEKVMLSKDSEYDPAQFRRPAKIVPPV